MSFIGSYYCVSTSSSVYDHTNFSCEGIEVYKDASDYKIILGLSALETATFGADDKKEGIVVKSFSISSGSATNNDSDKEWDICLKDNC